MRRALFASTVLALVLVAGVYTRAEQPVAAARQGQQYPRLVVRDGMLISGRGTPAEGPVDIVIERDRIVDIIPTDGVSLVSYGRNFQRPTGERVIDAKGMYVMPGIVDMHTHVPPDGPKGGFEYAYKLWLGHGITTLRDAGSDAGIETLVKHRAAGERNEMVVPRLVLYKRWPNVSQLRDKGHTVDEARALVRQYKEMGADGIKVSKGPGHYPDILAAIADEAKKLGMGPGVMVDLKVSETDGLIASNAGVRSIEHWYGIPDAAIPGTQHFPSEYNYWNEEDRFRWAGRLWAEAAKYPERLTSVLETMIRNGTNWDPTMSVYEGNRDLTRVKTLPWHEKYTMPSLMAFWSPNPSNHGSYHANWKTSDEVAWNENMKIWMSYVKKFFDMGGTLTVGSDAGSLYALYGATTIRELELLQETGIHPIDIIQIATRNPWKVLNRPDLEGIRIGNVADVIVVDGNPLDNFKVLYGIGISSFDAQGKPVRKGGVRWTIKAGAVFDAPALLRDVEAQAQKARGAKTTS